MTDSTTVATTTTTTPPTTTVIKEPKFQTKIHLPHIPGSFTFRKNGKYRLDQRVKKFCLLNRSIGCFEIKVHLPGVNPEHIQYDVSKESMDINTFRDQKQFQLHVEYPKGLHLNVPENKNAEAQFHCGILSCKLPILDYQRSIFGGRNRATKNSTTTATATTTETGTGTKDTNPYDENSENSDKNNKNGKNVDKNLSKSSKQIELLSSKRKKLKLNKKQKMKLHKTELKLKRKQTMQLLKARIAKKAENARNANQSTVQTVNENENDLQMENNDNDGNGNYNRKRELNKTEEFEMIDGLNNIMEDKIRSQRRQFVSKDEDIKEFKRLRNEKKKAKMERKEQLKTEYLKRKKKSNANKFKWRQRTQQKNKKASSNKRVRFAV